MTAGRPPHGLFCPSGRSLLAAHSYPALTRGHTTTLPCLATLPRLSPDPTHPAVLTLPPIRPPAVPDLRHAPVCRPTLPIRPSSPCRPSGHPPFQTCGTPRSVARSFLPPSGRPLLAAHPAARRSCPAVRPGLSPGPSPVRPPLHLPSSMPLPYNRSPVHGSAFLTPRTPRSAAQPLGHPAARPPSRSATLGNTPPGGFDRLLPAELSPSARNAEDLAGKNSFFHAEAVSLQPQRQWYLPQTAARSGCADDTCINVEHTLHPGSRYGGS